MKKTLTGMAAYSKMRSVELPERTKSYTPIPHSDVIMKIKQQIIKSGFIIAAENYNCTTDGKIGAGSFGIVYQSDPDITLCLNFLNSYNKMVAFRLSMGGLVKGSNLPFQLSDNTLGHFRRVHTGAADVLSSDKISEMIKEADEVWDQLYKDKEFLRTTNIDKQGSLALLGEMFITDTMNTYQMNLVKDKVKSLIDNPFGLVNSWEYYKVLLEAAAESHPASWIGDMTKMHKKMLKAAGYDFPAAELSYIENEMDDDETLVWELKEETLVDTNTSVEEWDKILARHKDQEADREDLEKHEADCESDGEHDEDDESEEEDFDEDEFDGVELEEEVA